MAKTEVLQWDTNPESNTDIAGINIAEGCPAAGINDAIRTIMAQVRSIGTSLAATVAEIFTGTATDKLINPKNAADSAKWVTVAYGSTITFDGNTGFNFKVTLTGNATVAFTNMKEGQPINIVFIQDATGNRVVTWDSGMDWDGASAPPLTTTANAKDLVSGIVYSTSPLSIISTIPVRRFG